MAGADTGATLKTINEATATVARADEPYWPATELLGIANHLMTEIGVAYRLWHMWSALTDRFELKPEERPEAEATMRRAASEWIATATDNESRDAYLDRWLFDEIGLDRKIGREF